MALLGSLLLAISGATSAGAPYPGALPDAWYVAALAAGIAFAAALWGILAWAAKGSFDAGRRWGWREMALTTLPLVVCEEHYARQILEIMETVPMLRWVSPPPPRRLEQQLEFAACYHRAYQRLRFGPGRLDTGTVWLGSLRWFLGQRMCCFCGCMSAPGWLILPLSVLSILTTALWGLGGYIYLYRLGVEAAFVEYFLEEGALGGWHPEAGRGAKTARVVAV